jgi:hypothetical protein
MAETSVCRASSLTSLLRIAAITSLMSSHGLLYTDSPDSGGLRSTINDGRGYGALLVRPQLEAWPTYYVKAIRNDEPEAISSRSRRRRTTCMYELLGPVFILGALSWLFARARKRGRRTHVAGSEVQVCSSLCDFDKAFEWKFRRSAQTKHLAQLVGLEQCCQFLQEVSGFVIFGEALDGLAAGSVVCELYGIHFSFSSRSHASSRTRSLKTSLSFLTVQGVAVRLKCTSFSPLCKPKFWYSNPTDCDFGFELAPLDQRLGLLFDERGTIALLSKRKGGGKGPRVRFAATRMRPTAFPAASIWQRPAMIFPRFMDSRKRDYISSFMNIAANESMNRCCAPANSEQLAFVPNKDLNQQVT